MLRSTLILVLLFSFGCSGQQFSGAAKNKDANSKDSKDGATTPPPDTSEQNEPALSTAPVVSPVPVAGAYLSCNFTTAVDMLCSPSGAAQAVYTKIYSISGLEAKWAILNFEASAEGSYLIRAVPEAAFAIAFVHEDGTRKFVSVPVRIQAQQNLFVDGSFESNVVTSADSFARFSTVSKTPWSFEGAECSGMGGFMDLGLWKSDASYKAFEGNQWASLENLCRTPSGQSFSRNLLYQNFTLKRFHTYLLRFALRTTSTANPNSLFELQYAQLSQLTAAINKTDWSRFDFLLSGNDINSAIAFANRDLNNPVDIDDVWLIDLGAP